MKIICIFNDLYRLYDDKIVKDVRYANGIIKPASTKINTLTEEEEKFFLENVK